MVTRLKLVVSLGLVSILGVAATAQNTYHVVPITNGGTISGTVQWSGPMPRELEFPVTKDPQICDPESKKTIDLDRLLVGPHGGVANTIVYLKDVSSGKPFDL